MKFIRFMLVLLAAIAAARAAEITLADGRKFTEATITTQTPTHVTIRHSGGIAKVSKSSLPEPLRAQYPVDEVGAEKERQRDAALKESLRKKAEEKNERERAQRAADYEAESQRFQQAHAHQQKMNEAGALGMSIVNAQFVAQNEREEITVMKNLTVYFCTLQEWDAYQERRREKYETAYRDYLKEASIKSSTVTGKPEANVPVWNEYRKWLSGTYAESPIAFQTVDTDGFGRISLPIDRRPFIMFVRNTNSNSDGWGHLLWTVPSSRITAGVVNKFTNFNARMGEPWGTDSPRESKPGYAY